MLEGKAAGEYMAGHTSWVRREPIGVVGQVTPWNYPLMMAAWKLAPALAAGNSVVIKPSEQTPLTLLKLAALCAELFPAGVVNVVTGRGPSVGSPLINHGGVRMISVTGSVGTGQKVIEAAVSSLKRTHLELGGKAPGGISTASTRKANIFTTSCRTGDSRRVLFIVHRHFGGGRFAAAQTSPPLAQSECLRGKMGPICKTGVPVEADPV